MDMYPVDDKLSNLAVNKIFLNKSFTYTTNAKIFYTDGSKLDKDAPTGASVYSSKFNFNIIHRLPVEASVFSAEAAQASIIAHIYLAINTLRKKIT